jgi:hypothetical protein
VGRDVEEDLALQRVLDRRREDLAAGDVQVPVVDERRAAVEAEAQIRAVADDPHVARGVEPLAHRRHLAALLVPVPQARLVEDVLERGERQARPLGVHGAGKVAPHGRDLTAATAVAIGGDVSPEGAGAVLAQLQRIAFGREHEDRPVHLVQHVLLERRQRRGEIRRRGCDPVEVGGEGRAEGDPRQSVGASLGEQSRQLPCNRPRLGGGGDEHLPARLGVDAALDEEPCIGGDTRVEHERESTAVLELAHNYGSFVTGSDPILGPRTACSSRFRPRIRGLTPFSLGG